MILGGANDFGGDGKLPPQRNYSIIALFSLFLPPLPLFLALTLEITDYEKK